MVRAPLGTALLAAALVAYAPAATEGARRRPPRDVGSALRPCPPSLKTLGVREVRSTPHRYGDCLAVRGRLRATVSNGGTCNAKPAVYPGPRGPRLSRCRSGWVLSDLSDPPVEIRETAQDATPTVGILDAGSTKDVANPSIRPLLACNRDASGRPIMPAGTRFQVPHYEYEDAAALNKHLGEMTVVAFGGQFARDHYSDAADSFEYMFVTHLCRLP